MQFLNIIQANYQDRTTTYISENYKFSGRQNEGTFVARQEAPKRLRRAKKTQLSYRPTCHGNRTPQSWDHKTSGDKSFHIESISWRLNELTEGAATIDVGSLFQNFTTRTAKAPTRTLQNIERVTSQAWPHWQNKKEAGVQIQSSICVKFLSALFKTAVNYWFHSFRNAGQQSKSLSI